MWSREENRVALLELYHSGRLPRRRTQEKVWDWLAELPWTRRTGRRNVLSIAVGCKNELEQLLMRVWPAWQPVLEQLLAASLPVSEQGWSKLCDLERAAALGSLPSRLNRRTASALVGPHSKASLSRSRREALGEMNTTHDGIVRLRPNEGLLIARENHTVEAASISDIAGEVVLTERAFNGGTKLTGNLPRAVLLVENLGPYLDVPSPEGWLIAHVPGWDTATVRLLLEQLVDIPVVHFGDLDPNGVRITSHLRSIRPDVRWAVPDFWREYVRKCGRRLTWPDDLNLDGTPPLVRDLAKAGLWLEQEPIILDERMSRALEDFLDPSHCLHR